MGPWDVHVPCVAGGCSRCVPYAYGYVNMHLSFKPRCAVPIVLESQKLVVAKLVRNMSEHTVAIRSMRDDVIKAVQRDFGTLFQYWRLGEGTLPEYAPVGMEYIIADDELISHNLPHSLCMQC